MRRAVAEANTHCVNATAGCGGLIARSALRALRCVLRAQSLGLRAKRAVPRARRGGRQSVAAAGYGRRRYGMPRHAAAWYGGVRAYALALSSWLLAPGS